MAVDEFQLAALDKLRDDKVPVIIETHKMDKHARRLYESLGIGEQTLPCCVIFTKNPYGTQFHHPVYKYLMDPKKSKTLAAFEEFDEHYSSGAAVPHVKSEPILTEQEQEKSLLKGNAFITSGLAWQRDIIDVDMDVFVVFHAPWCGHCIQMMPKYKELAQALAHVKSLRIAMIDATQNEVQNVVVRGYPTFFFYKKTDKQSPPKECTTARNQNAWIPWLKTQVAVPFHEDATMHYDHEQDL